MRPVHSLFWRAVIEIVRGEEVDLLEHLALALAAALLAMMAIGLLVAWQAG